MKIRSIASRPKLCDIRSEFFETSEPLICFYDETRDIGQLKFSALSRKRVYLSLNNSVEVVLAVAAGVAVVAVAVAAGVAVAAAAAVVGDGEGDPLLPEVGTSLL